MLITKHIYINLFPQYEKATPFLQSLFLRITNVPFQKISRVFFLSNLENIRPSKDTDQHI